jgi:hypothetical protein
MHFVDEVLQHFLGNLEIGNDAVFQGPDGGNVAWRSTQHTFGVSPDRSDCFLAIVDADGNNGGFIEHDATIADVNEGVGSSKIDRKIIGKHASQLFQHGLGGTSTGDA